MRKQPDQADRVTAFPPVEVGLVPEIYSPVSPRRQPRDGLFLIHLRRESRGVPLNGDGQTQWSWSRRWRLHPRRHLSEFQGVLFDNRQVEAGVVAFRCRLR